MREEPTAVLSLVGRRLVVPITPLRQHRSPKWTRDWDVLHAIAVFALGGHACGLGTDACGADNDAGHLARTRMCSTGVTHDGPCIVCLSSLGYTVN